MLKSKNLIKNLSAILLSVIFILSAACISNAAEDKKDNDKPKLIEINYTFQEVVYAVSLLNRIQLGGDEVIPFLKVYNPLMESAEQARKQNKKQADIISVKMSIPAISNLITFTQRATLTGAEAAQFDSIIKKAVENAKKAE
ncbi:MAG: hypothetical protein JRJ49_11000 [Deltaproteobacteria bacterium]|nr:hypothetical protein [Deltaproteobacteria bacterium]